jgi:predicted transcriptional regulator
MTEEHVTDLVKRVPGLTSRQAEAARKLLNQGLTLQEIARRLGYSRESVSRAIKKLASGGTSC